MKSLTICKIFLLATLPLCAWDSDRERDEDRRNSQFENTRDCECPGKDWSQLDRDSGRESNDRDPPPDNDRQGLYPSHDDSKD